MTVYDAYTRPETTRSHVQARHRCLRPPPPFHLFRLILLHLRTTSMHIFLGGAEVAKTDKGSHLASSESSDSMLSKCTHECTPNDRRRFRVFPVNSRRHQTNGLFSPPQPLLSLTVAPLTTASDRCTTARVRAHACGLRIGKTTEQQRWRCRPGTTVKDPDTEETVDTHSHKPSDAAFCRWLGARPPSCISTRHAVRGGFSFAGTIPQICSSPPTRSPS